MQLGTGAGSTFSFTTPAAIGVLVATATATDSDGGVGSTSVQIVEIVQSGVSVTIDPSAGTTVYMGMSEVSNTAPERGGRRGDGAHPGRQRLGQRQHHERSG